jgi:serine/threonine-protein kinase
MEKLAAGAAADSPSVRFSRNLIGDAELETAAKRLARYLGPIAKVIAKKTPGRPTDLKAFYRQLAQNIADPVDRARFLKDAGCDR